MDLDKYLDSIVNYGEVGILTEFKDGELKRSVIHSTELRKETGKSPDAAKSVGEDIEGAGLSETDSR